MIHTFTTIDNLSQVYVYHYQKAKLNLNFLKRNIVFTCCGSWGPNSMFHAKLKIGFGTKYSGAPELQVQSKFK